MGGRKQTQNRRTPFDMNAYRFKDNVQSKLRIMFSITLGWFYGSVGILTAIYAVMLFCA